MQTLLILLAPALFAASIYIILGRIILLADGERYSPIRKRRLTKIFVTGDVIAFLIQSAGGGIEAMKTLSSVKVGQKVIIVGLFAQLVSFGLFIVVSVTFQVRMQKDRRSDPSLYDLPWKRHLNAVYIASLFIMVRSIFRVIEYIMGNNGFLLRHEYFLYVFDAVLMLLVMLLFNWIHPSQITSLLYKKRESTQEIFMQDAGRP